MIRLLNILIILLVFQASFAARVESVFSTANKLYEQGQYEQAAKSYIDVLKTNPVAEIHYNLGNCYYKMGQMGQAVLHYERALLLKPDYDQARENLNVANTRIVDKVDSSARKNLSSYWNKVLQETGSATFGLICIILWFIATIAFVLFVLSRIPLLKKIGFFSGLLTSLAALVFLYLSLSAQHAIDENKWAIITNEKVDAYTEPKENGTAAFVLHEGTKVHINSRQGDWLEVSIQSGATGWMKSAECSVI